MRRALKPNVLEGSSGNGQCRFDTISRPVTFSFRWLISWKTNSGSRNWRNGGVRCFVGRVTLASALNSLGEKGLPLLPASDPSTPISNTRQRLKPSRTSEDSILRRQGARAVGFVEGGMHLLEDQTHRIVDEM